MDNTQPQFPLGAKIKDDPRNIHYASVVQVAGATIPDFLDLEGSLPPVDSQIYGSCEGFTLMDLIEAGLFIRGNFKKKSGRFAYAATKRLEGNQDQGAYTIDMLKVGIGVGICDQALFPNDPGTSHLDYISNIPEAADEQAITDRLDGFASIYTLDELYHAIATYAPIYGGCPITIPVYSDYLKTDADGLIQQPPAGASLVGSHELTAVGYDRIKGLIKIKNHWGNSWGKNGYGWLPVSYAGDYPIKEAFSVVDFIDPAQTSGAPIALAYPLKQHTITQHFGENPDMYKKFGMNGHNGIDFHAPTGTEVFAADDGTVVWSSLKGGYGNCVMIQHAWGFTLYGHLNDFVVSALANSGKGQVVQRGQLIAHSDNTGNSTAPHLHFGIRINGVRNPGYFDWVDPLPYLKDNIIMSNAFIVGYNKNAQGGFQSYGIVDPDTAPEAIISDALNRGIQIPMKPGVPDTAPAAERIDWDALNAMASEVIKK